MTAALAAAKAAASASAAVPAVAAKVSRIVRRATAASSMPREDNSPGSTQASRTRPNRSGTGVTEANPAVSAADPSANAKPTAVTLARPMGLHLPSHSRGDGLCGEAMTGSGHPGSSRAELERCCRVPPSVAAACTYVYGWSRGVEESSGREAEGQAARGQHLISRQTLWFR